MKCDELLPNYLLYAIGKMEEPELSELRAHLARGCEDCTAGVRAARAMAFSMGADLEGQEPSAQLRSRVMAIPDNTARREPDPAKVGRRPFWMRPMPVWQALALAAACLVLALIPAAIWNATQTETAAKLASEQRSVASLQEQVAKLQRAASDRGPQAVPIFVLELARGTSDAPVQTLTIPHGASSIVLALPIDLLQRASAAELRNASGQTIWTASPLVVGNSESAGLTVPTERLQAGTYSIELRAGDGLIARLPFGVVIL